MSSGCPCPARWAPRSRPRGSRGIFAPDELFVVYVSVLCICAEIDSTRRMHKAALTLRLSRCTRVPSSASFRCDCARIRYFLRQAPSLLSRKARPLRLG